MHALAFELGLGPQQANHAADVAHWSYRLGDLRTYLACANLPPGAPSRWHCTVQRLPLAELLVQQLRLYPQFRELKTEREDDP